MGDSSNFGVGLGVTVDLIAGIFWDRVASAKIN